MLLSGLCKLTFLLLSSHRTLFLSWVMSLSTTLRSTQEFRSLDTSGNKSGKLVDNVSGSTGSQYSSTPFHSGKGMSSSYSVPHDRTDPYKSSIFSGFVASPLSVGNTPLSFLLLYFLSLTVSTVFPSSKFWTVTCLQPSTGLGSNVSGSPSS